MPADILGSSLLRASSAPVDASRHTTAGAVQIAAEPFVTEATVKTHVVRILAKLALHDRTQAAVAAYEHRLVAPSAAERPDLRQNDCHRRDPPAATSMASVPRALRQQFFAHQCE